ncbi:transglycosylase SLT domain-containing protein [Bacillus haynesii]|uniref:transglycosylase SLT domain-containing protein n=1 Tax=Bacillus haynesii TaxID=1925021 RepID=UPI002DB87554|nr:transglycosylase SLT domain-containing protein [Bacillus haynesii]MEC1449440.1 transglycosylase SLT domain-containing protein [Bacillus haynesii]
MAKLTARFELEDRVSKKLRRIQKGFSVLEKRAERLSRQIKINIKTEDQAFFRLKKLNNYLMRKFIHSVNIGVNIDDQASAQLIEIQRRLKRIPAETTVKLNLADNVSQKLTKIKRMLSKREYSFSISAEDRVTLTVKKIIGYLKNNLKKGYSVQLYVLDKVTKTASRIASLLKKLEKTYIVTIDLNDKATNKIKNKKVSGETSEVKHNKKGSFFEQGKDLLGEWWKKSGWPWIKDTGKEIGKAFVDRFKDRLMEKLNNDIFDKIIDKILGPQSTKGSQSKSSGPGHGQCCCCLYPQKEPPNSAGNSQNVSVSGSSEEHKGWNLKSLSRGILPAAKILFYLKSLRPNKEPGKLAKLLEPLKPTIEKLKPLGKKLSPLGKLLPLTDLIGINKDNAGEKIGSVGGRMLGTYGGEAAGMTLGGLVAGPPGAVIGGVVGGFAGGMGGEKAGGSLGKMFDTSQLKEDLMNTLFNGDWWSEQWDSLSQTATNTFLNGDWWGEKWGSLKETATNTFLNGNWWAEQAGYLFGTLEATFLGPLSNVWGTITGTISETIFNGDWWSEKWNNAVTWAQNTWDGAVSVWDSITGTIKDTVFNGDWWGEQWDNAVTWAQNTWDGAVSVWDSITGTIKDTVFNGDWWGEQWDNAVTWAQNAWDGAVSVWDSITGTIKDTVFNGDWWSDQWNSALERGKSIFEGVKSWVGEKVEYFQKGRERAHKDHGFDGYATGGYITKPTISWIGEAGNEFVIPTENNRGRGKMLLAQAATKLGMRVVDDMGAAAGDGGTSSPVSSTASYSASVSPAVGVGNIAAEAQAFGREFTGGFNKGIGSNAPSLDQWKQKNISKPFSSLPAESSNYGKQTVAGFASGQNASATGTGGFLQAKVNAPYQTTVKMSSSWGANTVKNFSSGQNATPTGTSQYVDKNINKPFLDSKQSAAGWGSGMVGHFISGMNGKGSEVSQAAKNLAKKVEKAFREELDIHSPSRVMMSLGRFASVGIVKGLSSVDVKSFAEKQAGSLAAAFSGIGAVGGNVKSWLMQAIMATGSPVSWLQPLSVIAQKESGGNPRAYNGWDINAKRGDPSRGLMQTIGQTFNAYKRKGMNDIFNPVHNAVAAINYIKSRYGSPFNTPGIKSMARGGAYKGYANGGLITSEQIARVGEGGKREWIIPEERGIRGRYLLQRAAGALGMEVHDPAEGSGSISNGQAAAATAGGGRSRQPAENGAKEVNIYITGDNHYHSERDQETLIAKIKRALVDELERDIHIGTKGSVAYD